MKKIIALTMLALFSTQALAVYNANMSGQIDGVITYADTDSIYIRLKNQPTSHQTCSAALFAIDATVSLDRRKMMLSRLLAAYATGEVINIGYDSTGYCADGYIRVHRVG